MRRPHMPGYVRVLRRSDLRLLFGGLVVSAAGSWAYNVALVVYAYRETHSAVWVSSATLGRFIPLLLFMSYAGVIAERFERVRVMVSADVGCTVLMSLVAVLSAVHAPVLVVLVPAALNSIVASVYQPAVAAMLPQMAGEDDLAAANALNATIDNLAIIAGPGIGALLLVLGPPPIAFAVNAATFAFSALVVSRLRTRSVPSDVTSEGSVLVQIWNGFRAMTTSATAALLVSFSVLASFVYGTDTVVLVYVSRERLGTGSSGYGLLLGALGVGGVLGAMAVDRLSKSRRLGRVIVIGMFVYCMPTVLLAFIHSPALAAVIEAVRGAGTIVVDTLAITALQRSLPREMVARVFGAFFTLVLVAISLGSLLSSQLVDATSLRTTLFVLAFGVPAIVTLTLPLTEHVDRVTAAALAKLEPRIALLDKVQLFADARRAVLERLAGSAAEVEFATGSPIVSEGEEADALYVIESGRVTVTARGEGDTVHVIRDMHVGDFFGEIGLLEGIPRTATVTAAEPTTVLRIGADDFVSAVTDLSANPAMLEGARTRLQHTHPSYRPSFAAIPQQPAAADDETVSVTKD